MEDLICESVDKGGNQETASPDEQARAPKIIPFTQGKKLTEYEKEYR